MRRFRPVFFAVIFSGVVPQADAQIQINGGGTITFTPSETAPARKPRPKLSPPEASAPTPPTFPGAPAPSAPSTPPSAYGLEDSRLLEEMLALYKDWHFPLEDAPKVFASMERLYQARKEHLGETHLQTVEALRTCMLFFRYTNDLPGQAKWAMIRYKSVAKAVEEMDPDRHGPELSMALGDLISAMCQGGQTNEAGPYVTQAVPLFNDPKNEQRLHEHTFGLVTGDLMSYQCGLQGIGEYYRQTGDPATGEVWLKRSLQYAKDQTLGSACEGVAIRSLADLYEDIRDYRRAEPLLLQSYQIYKKRYGEDARQTIDTLQALGWNYNKQSRYAEAESCTRKALDQVHQFLPNDGRRVDSMVNQLADVLYHAGKSDEAAGLYQTAIAAFEKTGDPLHIAVGHFNRGLFLAGQKKLPEAEKDFQKALDVYDQLDDRGNDDVRDRALYNLALAQWRQGEKDAARGNARRWVRGFDNRLAKVLSFTDEDQRMAWLGWQRPLDLTAFLDMDEETALMLLRTKGVVLDSIMEDRAVARLDHNGPASADWESLKKVRDDIRQIRTAGSKMDKSSLVKLEEKESALQGGLARAGVSMGQTRALLSVTLPDVQDALPKDAAFLDYFRFDSPDASTGKLVPHYGVVVHRADHKPKLVRLKQTAAEIDDMVQLFLHTMRKKPVKLRDKDEALETLMKLLYAELIQPLEPELDGVGTLILSPDNLLDGLPFSMLVDAQGQFLCARYLLRQVNSARDLVPDKTNPPATDPKTFAIYGGPNYRLAPREKTDEIAGHSMAPTVSEKCLIRPLPQAVEEAKKLAQRAASNGWHVDLHTGDEATEASLRAVDSPEVLLIITHGYYMQRTLDKRSEDNIRLTDIDGKPQRMRTLFDPMQRNAILLAGAEDTIEQWRQGQSDGENFEGVLTASKACSLNLHGTWLVTLDACDTGEGDIVAGEGVMGLRRAFTFAGARNVMMSLWPITELTAIGFVDEFYDKALASHDAAAALSETQRRWLPLIKRDRGLWSAIKYVGPIILVGKGQ